MKGCKIFQPGNPDAVYIGESELPRGGAARARRELARERDAGGAGRAAQDGGQRVGLPHDARLGRAPRRRGRRQVRRQEQERRRGVPGTNADGRRVDGEAGQGSEVNFLKPLLGILIQVATYTRTSSC